MRLAGIDLAKARDRNHETHGEGHAVSNLLETAIEAHGGLERWSQLDATLVIGRVLSNAWSA
jgi:hypothetical protein